MTSQKPRNTAKKVRKRPQRKPMSEEARQKLSKLAKERHAAGKFGGAEFGKLGGRGNTREKRLASEAVSDAAKESHEALVQVFKDGIDPQMPFRDRIRAAEAWLAVENNAEKLRLTRQRDDGERMDRAELISLLKKKLSEGPTAEFVSRSITTASEDVVDAVVVEED